MRKVLITGADGFLGKNVAANLLKRDVEVYAVVHPGNKVDFFDGEGSGSLHIYRIDLNDILDYIMDFPSDIDVMYHFAWNGVRRELRNDVSVQMGNIGISLACLKFAAEIGVKKVIFPGSTNEYLYYGKPIGQDAVPSPSDTYGAVKVALRYLCQDIAEKNQMEFVYTIIAGTYAADRKGDNVIYYTIEKLLRREKPSLTKLEQLWDYVYIDDVVDALIAVGERGRGGGVYAIGHGDNWPLENYIRIIHQKIDPALPIGIGEVPYAGTRLPCSCINLTSLTADTGFIPKVDFETGITKVIDKIRQDMEKCKNGG